MMAWRPPEMFFNGALGAHEEAAAAGAVGLGDGGLAEDEAAGGEVRPLTCSRTRSRSERGFVLGFFEQRDAGVDDLSEVVGGMLVAMPTAMPELPLTMRLGMRAAGRWARPVIRRSWG